MSITLRPFTQPSGNPSSKPKKQVEIPVQKPKIPIKPEINPPKLEKPGIPEQNLSPSEKTKETIKKRLQLEVQNKQKQLKKLITSSLYTLAKIILAEDPNDDPQELFRQITPTLSKMNIKNIADAGKTQIDPIQIKGDNRLYIITLRRNADINIDQISRINRNQRDFEKIERSKTGEILVYVWGTYTAPPTI